MFDLRDYQSAIVAEVRAHFRAGIRSVLVQAPTGSGKTVLTAHMLATAASRGNRSWFIVHRRELVQQSSRTLRAVGVQHGIVAAGFEMDRRPLVSVCGIQTLARRLARLPKPDMIVWDECHHLAAGGWSAIHAMFPDARHIGLSATPERLDGQGLGAYFKRMVRGPSTRALIDAGALVPYRMYAPSSPDLEGVHTRAGDFAKNELTGKVDKPSLTGNAVEHYRKLAMGRRAVVFCVGIEHSQHVVQAFNAVGMPAAHVDGETDPAMRDKAIRDFECGALRILSNVDLFGEGFDLPAMEAVIMLRPTQSLGLYLQQIGRALRTCDGKQDAVILDHAGNCQRHGLPDEEREWRLEGMAEGKKRARDPDEVPIRQCPACFAISPARMLVCRECQEPFPVKSRKIEVRDGTLEEVTADNLRRVAKKEQALAGTIEALTELGRMRGYKNPERWAGYVAAARLAKKQRRA